MAKANQILHMNEAVEKPLGFAAVAQSGNMLYLSGIIAADETLKVVAPGDMAGQITHIYNLMEATLGMYGADLSHVVNEIVFVTNIQALVGAGDARTKRYAKCAPPACTAVQVSALFLPEAMIEIHAVAEMP